MLYFGSFLDHHIGELHGVAIEKAINTSIGTVTSLNPFHKYLLFSSFTDHPTEHLRHHIAKIDDTTETGCMHQACIIQFSSPSERRSTIHQEPGDTADRECMG